MADQVLTIVYDTDTGVVTHSGLTGNALPLVVRNLLAKHGLDFNGAAGPLAGRIIDPDSFNAVKRATIKTDFDRRFDQDPNPYHATDNLTLVFAAA